jgi:hypothetical protein
MILTGLPATPAPRAAAADLTDDEQREGFVSLCDGSTLAGWTGAVDGYTVEDGVIACNPKTGGNLFTAQEYSDFVLRFEFQLTPGSNNGIGLRVPAGGHASYDGMEIQVLDNTAERYAQLQPYQYHGSVYGIIPAKRGYLKPVGAWNTQEIRCIGRRVTVILNGETIVDGDLDEASAGGTIDHKEHPGLERTAGHIVLCGHGSDVKFRRMRVRDMSRDPLS